MVVCACRLQQGGLVDQLAFFDELLAAVDLAACAPLLLDPPRRSPGDTPAPAPAPAARPAAALLVRTPAWRPNPPPPPGPPGQPPSSLGSQSSTILSCRRCAMWF